MHYSQIIHNFVNHKYTNMKITRLCSISVLSIISIGTQAQETKEMVYPQAEWSKAGEILMHTPGQELFNGVIHPSAELFENYFDVEKATEEHKGYIDLLEKHGLRVRDWCWK